MNKSVLLQAYLKHERELLRFLDKRLGSSNLAADIVHDLYLKLRRGADTSPVRDSRSYLFSMAANLATDHLRVESRRMQILAEAEGVAWRQVDELTPERRALGRAELDYMKAEIAGLDPRCRRIFYLSRYEGRSQAEIAEALGVGLTTVYKDLKKAMSVLIAARRRFNGQCRDESGHGIS